MKLYIPEGPIPLYLQDFVNTNQLTLDSPTDKEFGLIYQDQCLQLQSPANLKLKNFRVDFLTGDVARRKTFGGGQELAKAIGSKSSGIKKVLDLTMGWGRESFLLASWGFDVLALEKNPVVYLLVMDAWQRWLKSSQISADKQRLRMLNTSYEKYLEASANNLSEVFDCAYLDPMFPERTKSAKVKKEMQILQKLVEEPPSEATESIPIDTIFQSDIKKIVIKRPIHAEPLAPGVNKYIEGKGIRFDIYFK